MANQSIQTLPAEATADAAILTAWERRKEAFFGIDEMVVAAGLSGDEAKAAEDAYFAQIGEAEAEIARRTATTLAGLAPQLWISLHLTIGDMPRDIENAIINQDLDWLEARTDQFDSGARLTMAALRSLKAMGA